MRTWHSLLPERPRNYLQLIVQHRSVWEPNGLFWNLCLPQERNYLFNNSHGKKSLTPPIPKFRHHDSLRSLMYSTHFGTWTMTKYLVAVYLSSSPITIWKTPMILMFIIIIFFHYFVDDPSELLGDTVRGLSYTEQL